ncbi:hypothetical protein EI555_013158 [Monodon monoceros]|uniref:Neuregulin 2 N-terminal domain-containing protein n=1 Tax=Monodon monoceros TaxID=40151 RepID=A0A4U1EZK4_MONMO|nr:hypothetical protein EI555_013158 [Monodon monoceros]
MRQVCCSALPPPPLEKARCSSYSDSSSSERSSSSSGGESSSSRSSSSDSNSGISRPAAPPEPRPSQQPQPRSPAAPRAAARSRAAAAGGMRRDPAPGFSMLLFGVSLACYSPSLKSVQDQAYKAPVVVEGKVQGLAPAGGSSSNSTREPPASGRVALVKVLDKWPLRSGGLQREQVISVGSCAPLERNQRYIFFLEPTEQPLVFKTAFAPLDTNGKNLKKEVGKILCTDCEKHNNKKKNVFKRKKEDSDHDMTHLSQNETKAHRLSEFGVWKPDIGSKAYGSLVCIYDLRTHGAHTCKPYLCGLTVLP